MRGSTDCPRSMCSHTGLHAADTMVVYFVEDAAGRTSFLIHNDAAPNADGGSARISLEAPAVANQGVLVQRYDDVGARNFSRPGDWYGTCANVIQDCHSWDTTVGMGHFSWRWVGLLHPPGSGLLEVSDDCDQC